MENFNSLGLPEALLHSLTQIQFNKPTPIQTKAIPHALNGLDILGSAQTGTGKTAAYGIPLISNLLINPDFTALIIAPTRELAFQIVNTIKQLMGKANSLRTALLIGGDSISEQQTILKKANPRLIVGTPGRIVDLLERGSLKLDKINFLVLDETDRMLDMGFTVDLDKIVGSIPKERQTLMFSATISPYIAKLSEKYLHKNAVRISVGANNTPNEKIKQELMKIHNDEEKYPTLLTNLNTIAGSVIIFVKTKISTEVLAKRLFRDGYKSDVIHGDLKQRQRSRAIKDFKNGKYLILVATDIAARGLDIPNIECVINYDLPQCPEDYIHRIGRTGRAGTFGRAINFVSNKDNTKWRDICKMMNPSDTSLISAKPNRLGKSRDSFKTRDSSFKERGSFRGRDSFNDRNSKSRFGENKSGFGANRTSFGEKRDRFSDNRNVLGEKRGGFNDNRNVSGEKRGGFVGNRDSFKDRSEFGVKDSAFNPRNPRSRSYKSSTTNGASKNFNGPSSFGNNKPFNNNKKRRNINFSGK